MTDTERLDFLLKYFDIEDVGDDFALPGIVVRAEELEDILSFGPQGSSGKGLCEFGGNVRDVIDRAIEAFKKESSNDPR